MKKPWYQRKRMWTIAIGIAYVFMNIWVSYQVHPVDYTWPERTRDILLRLVMLDKAQETGGQSDSYC